MLRLRDTDKIEKGIIEMKNLRYYAEYSRHGDHGLAGDCFELALHDFLGQELRVSPKGIIDLKVRVSETVKNFNKVESKTGAGEVPNNLRGNSYVIYCPVVDLDKPLNKQEAFIVKRTVFIKCLQDSGCYRQSKRTSGNTYTEAIQTFWNRKLNKPHGRKLEYLLEALYANCETTLEDWLGD